MSRLAMSRFYLPDASTVIAAGVKLSTVVMAPAKVRVARAVKLISVNLFILILLLKINTGSIMTIFPLPGKAFLFTTKLVRIALGDLK